MSLESEIALLLPDNTTGQITPLRARDAHGVLIPEVERSIKSNGEVPFDVSYVPINDQDPLTLKFQRIQTRGFIAETSAAGLNAEGVWAEVVVPFDGEAGRKFQLYAEIYFDTAENVNGEIQYQYVMKDSINQTTQTISRSRVEWDVQLTSANREFSFLKYIENSNVGGTATFRFNLMGNWNTPTNIQCDFAIYDVGTVI